MTKLKAVTQDSVVIGYAHWCPGCRHIHIFYTDPGRVHHWTFDGNMEKPTFSPSMRFFSPVVDGQPKEVTHCHYWLREGEIEFLADSSDHQLRGKHPLVDIPDGYGFG